MCGRFLLTSPLDALRRAFGVTRESGASNFAPSYNIAPTQPVWAVRRPEGAQLSDEHELTAFEWGLCPGWMDEPPRGRPLINARAETVAGKPAFRAAYRRRRCLVPADGWYEWQASRTGGPKQPYLIRLRDFDSRPFAFAGLWERRQDPETGRQRASLAILTMPAVSQLAEIHHRMPMLVAPAACEAWLDPARTPPADPLAAFATLPDGAFEAYRVSRRVNRVANDDPGLIQPVDGAGEPGPLL